MNITFALPSFTPFFESKPLGIEELAHALLEAKHPEKLRDQVSRLSQADLELCLKRIADLVVQNPKKLSVENIIGYFDRLKQETDFAAYTPAPESNPDRARFLRRIIPDFIDIFLKAFNILEAGRPPQSIWDFNALIAIYITALSFPAVVVKHMKDLVPVPLYAYGVSLGVVSLVVFSLWVYVKWLRPLPKHLPNCTDVAHGAVPPFVGREAHVRKITKLLDSGFNVIVKGESGAGKSSIIPAVARAIQDKKIQQIKDAVFGMGFCSSTDKLTLDFHEAENYPGQVVFYIDEMDKIMNDENLVKHFQEKLRKKQFQFIGTVSNGNFNRITEEFKARFQIYELQSATEEELRKILCDCLRREQVDCAHPEEWIDYVIKKASGTQPHAALNLFELAVHEVRHPGEYEEIQALIRQKRFGLSYPCFKNRLEEEIQHQERKLPVKVRLDKELIDSLVSKRPVLPSHGSSVPRP